MGHVWFIILISVCFTVVASSIWHASGINTQVRQHKAVNEGIIANTARITAYRDVLKEKGKEAAAEYFTAQSKGIYGN